MPLNPGHYNDGKMILKGLPLVLPDGMILFPLCNGTDDTAKSVPLLSRNVTIRPDNYRFMGSVAVEDSTTNLVPNSAFTGPDATGIPSSWTTIVGGSGDASRVTRNSILPPIVAGMSPTVRVEIVSGSNTSDQRLISANIPVTEGAAYSLSAYVRSNVSGKAYIQIIWQDSSNATIGSYIASSKVTAANDVQRLFVVNAVAPVGAVTARVEARGITMAAEWMDVCGFQFERKDHVTSFTSSSRGTGSLKYDISGLGMTGAGCVSCWVYNSDAMVNNKMTEGSVNNQYLIKLGSYVNNDWYSDCMTLSLMNTAPPRQFRLLSGKGAGNVQMDTVYSTVDPFSLGVGSWNHFVFQWSRSGLPSGYNMELYINGKREGAIKTDSIPVNTLTYLHVGNWEDTGQLTPATMYEQLAVHPSNGFSHVEILNWYLAAAPFYDPFDSGLTM